MNILKVSHRAEIRIVYFLEQKVEFGGFQSKKEGNSDILNIMSFK